MGSRSKDQPGAFGPAWLVEEHPLRQGWHEEMKALDSVNVRDTVIIQQKYQPLVKFAPVEDSTAKISWWENLNDKIDYKFLCKDQSIRRLQRDLL